MASAGKKLWVDIWFLTVLVLHIPNGDRSHGVHASHHSSHGLQSRRSLNRHPLLSLLDNNEANSVELKTLESKDLHKRNWNRDRSRYYWSYELHQDRDRNDKHSNSKGNERHSSPRNHNQGSLYDKLAPFISPKNLLVLKELLGDETDTSSRYNENRHRDNRQRETRHNEGRHENRQSDRNDDYHPYYSERDHRLEKKNRQSHNQVQPLDRREYQALRYRSDDQDRRQNDRDRRQDDRERRPDNRRDDDRDRWQDERDQRQAYRDRRDYDRDRRQDDRNSRQEDRDRRLDNRHQRLGNRHEIQNYRYQERKELDNKQYNYNQRYFDQYRSTENKRYRDSNKPGQHRERYDYRGSGQDQYRRPRRIDREKSYNNLRARLDEQDQRNRNPEHHDSNKKDQKYQADLKGLKARLSKNLQGLDRSPIKSLLRAANDLDCAAQLQCIQQCSHHSGKNGENNGMENDQQQQEAACKSRCEKEIECKTNDYDDALCHESGHESCDAGPDGTGSTKAELLELEFGAGC